MQNYNFYYKIAHTKKVLVSSKKISIAILLNPDLHTINMIKCGQCLRV